jgi:hypothetical protein
MIEIPIDFSLDVSNWIDRSKIHTAKKTYHCIVKQFGKPIAISNTPGGIAIWNKEQLDIKNTKYGKNCYDEVILRDEEIVHHCPTKHDDFIYTSIKVPVKPNQIDMLISISGSIIYDPLKNTVTARCASLEANIATLKVVTDLLLQRKVHFKWRYTLKDGTKINHEFRYENIDDAKEHDVYAIHLSLIDDEHFVKAIYNKLCDNVDELKNLNLNDGYWSKAFKYYYEGDIMKCKPTKSILQKSEIPVQSSIRTPKSETSIQEPTKSSISIQTPKSESETPIQTPKSNQTPKSETSIQTPKSNQTPKSETSIQTPKSNQTPKSETPIQTPKSNQTPKSETPIQGEKSETPIQESKKSNTSIQKQKSNTSIQTPKSETPIQESKKSNTSIQTQKSEIPIQTSKSEERKQTPNIYTNSDAPSPISSEVMSEKLQDNFRMSESLPRSEYGVVNLDGGRKTIIQNKSNKTLLEKDNNKIRSSKAINSKDFKNKVHKGGNINCNNVQDYARAYLDYKTKYLELIK